MYGTFKCDVADALVALLEPIQTRYKELRADETYLKAILKEGADKASERANRTLNAVYEKIGFMLP